MITLFKQQRGFTLIELVISMAIFGFLAATMFMSFRGSDREEQYRIDVNFLASNMRRVQNLALSGASLGSGTFPRGGYGISIRTCDTPICTYLSFAEESAIPNQRYDILDDTVTQTMDLSRFTTVTSIEVMDSDGSNAGTVDQVDISFKPPRPTPFVWWTGGTAAPPPDPSSGVEAKRVKIVLQYTEISRVSKTIEIKGISGQISEYAN